MARLSLSSFILLSLASFISADSVLYNSASYTAGELGVYPVQKFLSSSVTPPEVNVLQNRTTTDSSGNYTLLTVRGTGVTQPAPMMLDQNGSLVWSGASSAVAGLNQTYSDAMNLIVQQYRNESVLSFFQGEFFSGGYGYGEWILLAQNYSQIGSVTALNQTTNSSDFHEFVITENNTALVESWRVTQTDLSGIANGTTDGWTWDCVFQEVDIASNTLLFEWSSLSEVPVTETYFGISNNAGNSSENPFDYCHINSVDKDNLGNYLVSLRGPSTIYYISGQTGTIVWRLGGMNSSFTIGTGAAFYYQHDARFRSDPSADIVRLSLFDNGAGGNGDAEPTARAIELELDMSNMTATLVYEAVPSFNTTAPSQGSNSLLSDGHWFVGWGAVPQFSEYDANANLVWDVRFGVNASLIQSYRAFKQAWVGYPTTSPSLAINSSAAAVSWNGATEVAQWSLLGSSSATTSFTSISNTTKSGFETIVPISSSHAYYSIAALDSKGQCLGTSIVVSSSGTASTTQGVCPNGTVSATSSGSTAGANSTTGSSSGSSSSSSTNQSSGVGSLGGSRGVFVALMFVLVALML